MKVMVIVKAGKASEAGEMPSEKLLTEMGKYNEELVKAGVMLAGEGLQASSKGARVRFSGQERTVIDGPFAETKELIAGFWMWKVKSLEEAIAWVKKCPNPHDEPCELEIRPVFSADDFGPEFTPELREQEANLRAQSAGLGEIRFEQKPELRLAGEQQRYTMETRQNIPKQWCSFAPKNGTVPGQKDRASYGVCFNNGADCSFDYLSAVELKADAPTPAGFRSLTVPARRYAVFTVDKNVTLLPQTLEKIWTEWKPDCGLKVAHAPCVEHYAADFDPAGQGGIEIWIPLEA